MREAIDVVIRPRPTAKFAHDSVIIDQGKGEIIIKKPKKKEDGLVNHQQDTWCYSFNKIFLNETQSSFFEKTVARLIPETLSGLNGAIIAYGQTGAGKTFTISGSQEDPKYRGILPRTLASIFHQIALLSSYTFKLHMTYIEIHNENLHDLLSDDSHSTIVLQEDAELGVFPQGALMVPIRSEEEALLYMFRGESNKSIGEHKLNKRSSRSHTVLTVYIESKPKSESESKILFSKLSIFDLAGCERTKKTNSEGLKMLEASFINKSLSSLEQLVVAYNQKNREFLPYRQAKLTYLLKDSIGGNSKAVFIANIWPEEGFLEETISVLRFASKISNITNFIQKNTKNDTAILFKQYEQQIKDLKKELAMHDAFTERKGVNYDFFSTEEQQEQKQLAEKFLNGQIDDIEVKNIRQVKELFCQFKFFYENCAIRKEEKRVEGKGSIPSSDVTKGHGIEPSKNKEELKKVGKDDPKFGFGLGRAELDSKPPNISIERSGAAGKITSMPIKSPKERQEWPQEWGDSLEDLIKVESTRGNRNSLFAVFKETYGQSLALEINSLATQLKEIKLQAETVRTRCNTMKIKIETLQSVLKTSFQDSNDSEEETQMKLFEELKVLKAQYNEDFNRYKNLKYKSTELENLIYLKKKVILAEFNKFSVKFSSKRVSNENLTPELASSFSKNERDTEEEFLFDKARKIFISTAKALAAEKYISVLTK